MTLEIRQSNYAQQLSYNFYWRAVVLYSYDHHCRKHKFRCVQFVFVNVHYDIHGPVLGTSVVVMEATVPRGRNRGRLHVLRGRQRGQDGGHITT